MKKSYIIRSYIHYNNQVGSLIRVSTDTDFVCQNEEFIQFVDDLAQHIVAFQPPNIEELMKQEFLWDEESSSKVYQILQQQRKKFGENIEIDNFIVFGNHEEETEVYEF